MTLRAKRSLTSSGCKDGVAIMKLLKYLHDRPLAYPKTDVFLVCFCVCSFSSYKNVRDKWVPEIRQFCPTAPIVVVGTQLDRRGENILMNPFIHFKDSVNPPTVSPYKSNIISEDMGRKLSKELKAAFYHECSSLTREGVDRLFHDAIDLVVSKKQRKRKVHESCILL